MSIKVILAPFSGNDNEMSAIEAAIYIASIYKSHIKVINISSDPTTLITAGCCSDTGLELPSFASLADEMEQSNRRHAQIALTKCKTYAAKHSTIFIDSNPPRNKASLTFSRLTGNASDIIGIRGRISDLIVIGRTIENEPAYAGSIEAALFHSGSSLLITPPSDIKTLGMIIVIAWNGSAEAARAVFSSMLFYKHASRIYALQVNEDASHEAPSLHDLITYLECHEIHVEPIIENGDGYNAGPEILKKANELNADLLVMGAYTHNRLKQLVLGGVTNFIMSNSNIPVFMAH